MLQHNYLEREVAHILGKIEILEDILESDLIDEEIKDD